jgi:hypothetical protein
MNPKHLKEIHREPHFPYGEFNYLKCKKPVYVLQQ